MSTFEFTYLSGMLWMILGSIHKDDYFLSVYGLTMGIVFFIVGFIKP